MEQSDKGMGPDIVWNPGAAQYRIVKSRTRFEGVLLMDTYGYAIEPRRGLEGR